MFSKINGQLVSGLFCFWKIVNFRDRSDTDFNFFKIIPGNSHIQNFNVN